MRLLWLAILALLTASPALAHQQKVTISSVERNLRSGTIEVVHRIPLHDAEHALRQMGIRGPDIVYDIENRRAFARYVAERFSLSVNGARLALTLIGSEIEGGHLIVYQEGRAPARGSELVVHSQLLSEIWARQINRVNVGSGASINTLVFRANDGPKSVSLP